MSIKLEELSLLQNETQIKSERVFFEKADKPTSRTGTGIDEGILSLTNRRLFYLSIRKGRSTLGKYGINFAVGLADELTFGIASLVEYGVEKGIEHLSKENYEHYKLYSQREESFAIPIESIINCEKFGGLFSLPKNKFIKVTILSRFVQRIIIVSTVPTRKIDNLL